MKFLNRKLHDDILKKLNLLGKPQRYLSLERQGFNKSSIMSLRKGMFPRMDNFMSMCEWLESEPNRYFVFEDVDSAHHEAELFGAFYSGWTLSEKTPKKDYRGIQREFKKRFQNVNELP